MLYQIDGAEELIKIASKHDNFFLQLAHLIYSQQLKGILPMFEVQFGKNWSKKYQQILIENPHVIVSEIVEQFY